jgi:Transcriptional Coactivator p15 (PC4)
MTTIAQEGAPHKRDRSNTENIEPILIAEWPLERGEIVRVSIKKYNGTLLIDVRKFFEKGNGEFNPSSKGIALGIKNLNRLSAAMADALAVARQRNLISPDQEGGQ